MAISCIVYVHLHVETFAGEHSRELAKIQHFTCKFHRLPIRKVGWALLRVQFAEKRFTVGGSLAICYVCVDIHDEHRRQQTKQHVHVHVPVQYHLCTSLA